MLDLTPYQGLGQFGRAYGIMLENGPGPACSGAPYVARGRLMAPLRPIAVALGGTVRYDPKTRQTDISFADEKHIQDVLSYQPHPNVYVHFLPEG